MPSGISLKKPEDFARLYKDDPALALGLVFNNLSDIKLCLLTHIENHDAQFKTQVSICNERFVKRYHLVIAIALALGVGLGAGWIAVEKVLAHMI